MAKILPYINFADKGREAIEFYKSVFGGDAEVQYVKDSPAAAQMPKEWGERIFHLDFEAGDIHFLGSDIISDQAGKVPGNVYSLAITCDSEEQLKDYFGKLSDGGKVVWEPRDSEWGSIFGQCVDKFDVQWMLDYSKSAPKE
ncbi:MAG TPA: VOC family protein [Candidatus Saccharimonadales bacterium]|jgi:PhnB protein|nr:VOC family protein [Candidatus Saccharimonadales bacterium]